MSSSEVERFTLHQTLRGLMPEEVAATLMSHLPPAGWSDVALKSDIEKLETAVKHDIDELRTATKNDIAQLAAATKHQIDELRVATKNDIAQLAAATKHQIDELRTATKVQFDQLGASTKHEIDDLCGRVDRLETKIDNLTSMKRYVVTTSIAIAGLITGFGFAILGAVS